MHFNDKNFVQVIKGVGKKKYQLPQYLMIAKLYYIMNLQVFCKVIHKTYAAK